MTNGLLTVNEIQGEENCIEDAEVSGYCIKSSKTGKT